MKTRKHHLILGSLAVLILAVGGVILGEGYLKENVTAPNKPSIDIQKGTLTHTKLQHDDHIMAMALLAYGIHRVNSADFKPLSFEHGVKFVKSQPSDELTLYHLATGKHGQPYFAVADDNQTTAKYYTATGEEVATVKMPTIINYLNTNFSNKQLKGFTDKVLVEDDIAEQQTASAISSTE